MKRTMAIVSPTQVRKALRKKIDNELTVEDEGTDDQSKAIG